MDEESTVQAPKIPYKRVPLTGLVVSVFGLIILVVSQDPGQGGPVVIMPFLALLFVAYFCSVVKSFSLFPVW